MVVMDGGVPAPYLPIWTFSMERHPRKQPAPIVAMYEGIGYVDVPTFAIETHPLKQSTGRIVICVMFLIPVISERYSQFMKHPEPSDVIPVPLPNKPIVSMPVSAKH